jgi:hypothetical protein
MGDTRSSDVSSESYGLSGSKLLGLWIGAVAEGGYKAVSEAEENLIHAQININQPPFPVMFTMLHGADCFTT